MLAFNGMQNCHDASVPSAVGEAADSAITESWLILLHTFTHSLRFVLSLICFTGLSGILIKQCSEAAY